MGFLSKGNPTRNKEIDKNLIECCEEEQSSFLKQGSTVLVTQQPGGQQEEMSIGLPSIQNLKQQNQGQETC